MYLQNIEWEVVSARQDEWVDTYISYAEHEDGSPLSDVELEEMDEGIVYEYLVHSMPWL